jgi:PKHD-type hydroxylase
MSIYQLLPSNGPDTEHAFWENGFSEDEVSRIRQYGDSLMWEKASVGSGTLNEQLRQTQLAWITLNPETSWLYEKLGFIARQLNSQFFGFDLFGFHEDLQYTVYDGGGAHYGWHRDKGGTTQSPRKLSLVLQLSSPDEYDGGELQLFLESEPLTVKREKGLVYAFPSYVMHQVTPVTRGVRRSLVVWLVGPRFR